MVTLRSLLVIGAPVALSPLAHADIVGEQLNFYVGGEGGYDVDGRAYAEQESDCNDVLSYSVTSGVSVTINNQSAGSLGEHDDQSCNVAFGAEIDRLIGSVQLPSTPPSQFIQYRYQTEPHWVVQLCVTLTWSKSPGGGGVLHDFPNCEYLEVPSGWNASN